MGSSGGSGGSGGGSTPQTTVTTQNRDPWSGAQPHLQNIMTSALNNVNAGVGYQPYLGQTQADLHPWQSQGNDAIYQMANSSMGGTQGVQAGRNLATDIINSQGITSGIRGGGPTFDTATGAWSSGSGLAGLQNVADRLYQHAGNPAEWNQYNALFNEANGQANPYLQGILDTQGRKIGDQVNSTMSGAGRYGSGAHTNVLSRNLSEAQLPLLAQDYQNRQQQKMAATQGQQSALAQQIQANQLLGGIYSQMNQEYGQGLNRAGQFSQLVPQLDEAQYSPATHMQGLGSFYTDYAQRGLSDSINKYNAQQAYPWEQLNRYAALVNGAGGLGGSTVTTSPNMNAPVGGMQSAFGGALAGAGLGGSIFGAPGAAIGAGAGGLLGLLR